MKEILSNKNYCFEKHTISAPMEMCNLENSLQEFINCEISRKVVSNLDYNLTEIGLVFLEGLLKNGDKISVWGSRNVFRQINMTFCSNNKHLNIFNVKRLKRYNN